MVASPWRRGHAEIKAFMTDFRRAFPDLNFWGTADLIAEGDYVVGRWEGGGTHPGRANRDLRGADRLINLFCFVSRLVFRHLGRRHLPLILGSAKPAKQNNKSDEAQQPQSKSRYAERLIGSIRRDYLD
jgi:hypothetical protein